jgi:hypothetical protein
MQRCAVRMAILALVALGILGRPLPARAWTTASVRTVHARVTLSDDATRIHVELMAELRVEGGWLEGFELDGLDEGLVLDPEHPPVFERWAAPAAPIAPALTEGSVAVAEDAHAASPGPVFVDTLSPRIAVRGSQIAMTFPRRSAPRLGLYRAYVTYDAPAAEHLFRSVEAASFSWTLPAWRHGLDGVEITLIVPSGTTFTPLDEDEDASVDVLVLEPGVLEGSSATAEPIAEGHLGLRYTRVHLPRTQSWTVHAELPDSFRAAALPPLPPLTTTEARSEAPSSSPLVLAGLSLLLALVVVAKHRVREAEEARAEVGSGALIRMPSRLRTALVLLTLWGGWGVALFFPTQFVLTLVPLALLGTHGASQPREDARRLGSFRSAWGASPASVRAAQAAHRRHRSLRLLDASTWPGALVLAGLVIVLGFAHHRAWLPLEIALPSMAAFALVLGTGGGRSRPRDSLASLGALLSWTSRLEIDLAHPLAFAPLVHVDIRGRVQSARLRVVLPSPEEGLVRSDLVLDARGLPQLVLAARRGSPAERSLLELAARHDLAVTETQQDRTALVWPEFRLPELASSLSRPPTDLELLAQAS